MKLIIFIPLLILLAGCAWRAPERQTATPAITAVAAVQEPVARAEVRRESAITHITAAAPKAPEATVEITAATRDLTLQRDDHMEIRELLSQAQSRVVVLEGDLQAARNAEAAKDRKIIRTIAAAGMAAGGLAIIAGGIMFIWVSPKAVGGLVMSAGAIALALGMAAMYYGREIALAGAVIAVIALIAGVWSAIKRLRDDGKSIAQGVQQAIIAGRIKLDEVRDTFEMAQTPGAKKLIDEETK